MAEYDWSKFTVRIDIKADEQTLYDLWAKPSGLESWFLKKAEFKTPAGELKDMNSYIEKGDTYLWKWYGHDDYVYEEGKVLGVNGKDKITFTFAGDCIVTVTIKKEKDTTIVELTQENIPLDEKTKVNTHLGCQLGWTFHLANLKSILEGGVDLKNKNENLKGMLNS